MSQDTLFDKVWDLHKVSRLPGGSDQLFIGLHLINEVTSHQEFGALKEKNLKMITLPVGGCYAGKTMKDPQNYPPGKVIVPTQYR